MQTKVESFRGIADNLCLFSVLLRPTDCERTAPMANNELICDQCFCYICDKLASLVREEDDFIFLTRDASIQAFPDQYLQFFL